MSVHREAAQAPPSVVCSCGWTGPHWAAAKDHIVAVMGSGTAHEVRSA